MMAMAHGIQWLYPLSDDMRGVLEQVSLMILEQPLIYVLLVMAVLPAICEELAFRGFMLTGFRKIGRKWTAIVLSSVFFGVTHGLLQQSIAACVLGIVLGYIAIQTGSLIPGILFHMTYNSLSLVSQRITPELVAEYRILDLIYSGVGTNEFGYQLPVIVATGLLSLLLLLWWFRRLPQIGLEPDPLPPALHAQAVITGAAGARFHHLGMNQTAKFGLAHPLFTGILWRDAGQQAGDGVGQYIIGRRTKPLQRFTLDIEFCVGAQGGELGRPVQSRVDAEGFVVVPQKMVG